MRYTDTHEWVSYDSATNIATVGITEYAQKELGDIVYVELPRHGQELEVGEEVIILESTKAAIDLYTPLAGKIVEANVALRSYPERVNNDPMGGGWLFKLELTDASKYKNLLDESAYQKIIQKK